MFLLALPLINNKFMKVMHNFLSNGKLIDQFTWKNIAHSLVLMHWVEITPIAIPVTDDILIYFVPVRLWRKGYSPRQPENLAAPACLHIAQPLLAHTNPNWPVVSELSVVFRTPRCGELQYIGSSLLNTV